jgi:hypothetical protein
MVYILKRLIVLGFRKQKRHHAKEGVFVIYDQSMSKNQVDDISMGGLSFHYVDRGRKIDRGSYTLSLINHDRIFLGNVPFRTVSDNETGEFIFNAKKVKRQSVRFERLSHLQTKRLKAIIANLTNKERSSSRRGTEKHNIMH